MRVIPAGAMRWPSMASGCSRGDVRRARGPSAARAVQPPASSSTPAAPRHAQSADLFETQIRPLLAANCFACHGESAMAGLRVDSREGLLRGGDDRARHRARRSGQEHAAQGRAARRRLPAHAARPRQAARRPTSTRSPSGFAAARRGRRRPTRRRRRWRRTSASSPPEQRAFWAFQPLAQAGRRRRCATRRGRAPTSIASCSRGSRREGLTPVGAADKLHAAAPRHARPDRPAADARGGRRVSRRRVARRVRQGRRSPARVAALRRGVGPHVARRRALRRRRLSQPRPDGPRLQSVSQRVPVSRLGDPRVQRRPAVRPVRRRRSSPPICCDGPDRVRHLPALGFLGLGPWYYDNGAVEITRADERHDRVDAVTAASSA